MYTESNVIQLKCYDIADREIRYVDFVYTYKIK